MVADWSQTAWREKLEKAGAPRLLAPSQFGPMAFAILLNTNPSIYQTLFIRFKPMNQILSVENI